LRDLARLKHNLWVKTEFVNPAVPAPEQQHRRLLGLPFERQLSDPEIQQGYKRAAKRLHPDAGGSAHEFNELSAARDALLRVRDRPSKL
jgi:hypothetical protein